MAVLMLLDWASWRCTCATALPRVPQDVVPCSPPMGVVSGLSSLCGLMIPLVAVMSTSLSSHKKLSFLVFLRSLFYRIGIVLCGQWCLYPASSEDLPMASYVCVAIAFRGLLISLVVAGAYGRLLFSTVLSSGQ